MIDSPRRKSTACLKRNANRLAGDSTPALRTEVGLRAEVGFHANGSQATLSAAKSANRAADLYSDSAALKTLPQDRSEQHEQLAVSILKRIQARLPGRVRRLTVYVTDSAVVLAGKCSTYYTKQLAQHAAMGVLEDERLINNIEVYH